MQILTPEQARDFKWDILDITKVWLHGEVPPFKFPNEDFVQAGNLYRKVMSEQDRTNLIGNIVGTWGTPSNGFNTARRPSSSRLTRTMAAGWPRAWGLTPGKSNYRPA